MLNLPCVIIAGGKSSRMGSDKALLSFGGFKTLTQFQLNRHKSNFESLHVSCKSKNKFDFEADFIEDTKEFNKYSPLIALYSVLKKLDTSVCILSVDTPFVDKSIYEKLFTYRDNFDVVVARSAYGSHQLCAIYSPKILPILREQIEIKNHKIRDLLDRVKTEYVDFDSDEMFLNLNHKEDYEEAKKRDKTPILRRSSKTLS